MVSGAAWLVFVAGEIGGLPIADAVSQGLAWIVLTQTAFGGTWVLRLEMALRLWEIAVNTELQASPIRRDGLHPASR